MFLSAIPILLVSFWNGGIFVAFACIGMIAFVHAVEAYYLNPKIVSSYMHFPIFLTFLILLVSEHFFWLVGLLIWVPLFAITLSFAQDFNHYLSQLKHEIRNHDITQ
jgi:predicted PurR-regulated permease PerM